MVVKGDYCLLCLNPATGRKEEKNNQIKHQVRSIFVLQKLLDISSHTCVELLENGNPSTWISYCLECFETIIEAERVFWKLAKLEKKWENLKNCLRKTVAHNFAGDLQNEPVLSKTNKSAVNIVTRRIREEALQNANTIRKDAVDEPKIRIKTEVEDEAGCHYYDDVDGAAMSESEPGDWIPNNSGEFNNSTKKIKFSSQDDSFDYQNDEEDRDDQTDEHIANLKNNESGRTRSGRLTNSKYVSSAVDTTTDDDKCGQLEENGLEEKTVDDLDTVGAFPCNFCSSVSKSIRKRMDHENCVHGQSHLQECQICDKKFHTSYSLKQHLFVSHSGLPKHLTNSRRRIKKSPGYQGSLSNKVLPKLQCHECHRVFRNEAGRNYHQKRYHSNDEEKPFKCNRCGLGMYSERSVSRHMERFHLGKHVEFSCNECSICFPTESKLKSHVKKEHRLLHKCLNCRKSFESTDLLEFHLQSCQKNKTRTSELKSDENYPCTSSESAAKEKTYPCDKCDKGFYTYVKFRDHIINIHGETPPPNRRRQRMIKAKTSDNTFPCKECELGFSSKLALKYHVKQQHEKLYQCSECSKKFKNINVMNTHYRVVHRKERDFVCEHCGKSFSNKLELKYHIMKEHEQSSELKCKECGRICSNPSALRKHIAVVHNKTTCKFKCPVCDYGAYNKSSLEMHVLRRHTNERPFPCTLCSKSYVTSTSLKCHVRTHTGEKPYSCRFCQKPFHLLSKKKRHEQSLHSKEKPYQCEYCGKNFPSRHYCVSHIYDVHKKRQKDPVPEKKLIDKELLDEVINQNTSEKYQRSSKYGLYLRKSLLQQNQDLQPLSESDNSQVEINESVDKLIVS